ncbi:hypothetical protein [Streptomyces sp. NPDC048481]|uniref:hypothetical protein n=1 Tax=Streptomyces sp. NPDC048481 TaxID=3365557 RepID=UPI0037118BC2
MGVRLGEDVGAGGVECLLGVQRAFAPGRLAEEAIRRITTENATLKQRVRRLTADHRPPLDGRHEAASCELRFQGRRAAALEARIAEVSRGSLPAVAVFDGFLMP